MPAKEIAGDFYDFFLLSPDVLSLLIADVSGKGIPAAMFMAVTRTIIRNLEKEGMSPAQILDRANELLCEDNPQSMFVTIFIAHYNTKTGQLLYANGGHNPPYRLSEDGTLHEFECATEPMMGVFEGQEYSDKEVALDPGDYLVLYTDGVTEAHAPDGHMFGEERFENLLHGHASESPEKICKDVLETVDNFQMQHRFDDVTLLILRRNQT
jgi:sigma-B regulation protein RsbU (phosphoserine phosphatase)